MKSTVLWALVALNALLLVSFIGRAVTPNTAHAQPANQPRRPGDFVMIPGEVSGGPAGVVYMLDTTNARLGAISYDENTKRLVNMPPIDLAAVYAAGERAAEQQRGGGGRRGR